jgi:hypothetical protein
MSDKDEQPDVEGHKHGRLHDDELDKPSRPSLRDDDDTPDFEGHRRSRSPVRRHSRKPSKPS